MAALDGYHEKIERVIAETTAGKGSGQSFPDLGFQYMRLIREVNLK
jgi:hypothetical protein